MVRKRSLVLSLLVLVTGCLTGIGDDPAQSGSSLPTSIVESGNGPSADTPATAPTTTRDSASVCTEAGCDSLLMISLPGFDVVAEVTYQVEICLDDQCTVKAITIDDRNAATGEIEYGGSGRSPGLEGEILMYVDGDEIEYFMPAGDYGDSVMVTVSVLTGDAGVISTDSPVEVPLERLQPNGPDCPPICFVGRLDLT